MMRSVFFILLAFMVILSGCRTFKPEPELPLPVAIPGSFSTDAGGSQSIESWWLSFGSDELNGLINEALENNFDLKTLITRIIQAKAKVSKETAALFPDLGFSAGGQERGSHIKETRSSSSRYNESHSWDGSLSGSYTADVWGEVDAGIRSQVAGVKAAEHDFRQSALELTAQITETWIDIISVRNKKRILDNQININKTLLELQKLRYVNGKADVLDVSQQREALAEASSQVPLLEKQEHLLLSSLALLSGKTAVDSARISDTILPEPPPLPGVGIPSDLLENRPDIQAARMRLSSAQWEIAVAKADLLPSFTLTAQALFSSGKLDLLFQNWVATLAGSIAGPIFDGGLRKAEVERVKAVAGEQVNLYAKTVAKAVLEVEDSLVGVQKQDAYIRLLEEELSVARLTLKDAMVQYQNGRSSYLSYLTAWSTIERLERQLVGERAAYIKENIGLYHALGWKPVPELK